MTKSIDYDMVEIAGEKYLLPTVSDFRGTIQASMPVVEEREACLVRGGAFVREVIGDPREGIEGRDVRADVAREEPRGHRKILVMLARQPQAGRVGVLDYHSVSGTPARALTVRAITNRRSDTRFT